MKTKEQIQRYNSEYSARPEVIASARVRNARAERKEVRKIYKYTEAGKRAANKYNSRPEVRERKKWNDFKKRYGLDKEGYENLLGKQGGKCAICGHSPERFHVDHNHASGEVRALLCGQCNMAIGLLKEDINILKSAIKYLS